VQAPLLVTHRFLESNKWASDPRVTIVRPESLREVHALALLRARSVPKWLLTTDSTRNDTGHGAHYVRDVADNYLSLRDLWSEYSPYMHQEVAQRYQQDVTAMVASGWERSNEGFAAVKDRIWKNNVKLARRIVHGQ